MCLVCPSWLSFILYNPVRKAFTDRDKVLNECGISENSVVLEVGAGNGFFTEALAEQAAKVYAVELQDGMVNKLKKRVARFGEKVIIMQCDIASCGLDDASADACLLYYSFHEVKDKAGAAACISGALRAGSILSIYEPSVEVNKEEMRKTAEIFEDIGFKKEAERHGLFTRFARLRKPASPL
jgi:ubiquinone/menaquinone biosynthesis C-methylase UbiE